MKDIYLFPDFPDYKKYMKFVTRAIKREWLESLMHIKLSRVDDVANDNKGQKIILDLQCSIGDCK